MVTYTRYTQNKVQRRKRPFNTVNVRQCSMICEKDEIVFSLFLCFSCPKKPLFSFKASQKSYRNHSNTYTQAQVFQFFIIFWWYNKNNREVRLQENTERKLLWAVWSLGDFKVFSLRQAKTGKKFSFVREGEQEVRWKLIGKRVNAWWSVEIK